MHADKSRVGSFFFAFFSLLAIQLWKITFSRSSFFVNVNSRLFCVQINEKSSTKFLFKHQKIKTICMLCSHKKSYQAWSTFFLRSLHSFCSLFLWKFSSANFHSFFSLSRAHINRVESDINIYILSSGCGFLSLKTIMVIMIKYLCYAICFFLAENFRPAVEWDISAGKQKQQQREIWIIGWNRKISF